MQMQATVPSLDTEQDLLLRAIALQTEGKATEATALFEKLLGSNPGNGAAVYSLAVIKLQTGVPMEALALSSRGLELAAHFAPMHVVHAATLQSLGRKEEALASYDQGLLQDPHAITALLNSGVILREQMRHKEAVERFNRVIAIEPDNQAALANCAILLTEFKQSEMAIRMFTRLLQVNPDYDYGLGLLAYERLHICDWTDFEESRRKIIEGVRAGKRSCKSLSIMAFSDSAEDHLASARTFANHYCPKKPIALWNGERYRHERIRVAYVSPDLREHPVGHLIAGVFERHDKSRFETIAISLGVNDNSRLRARMLAAFDQFHDVQGNSSQAIAQLMRDLEVDIAVDLGGYTSDTRTEVFCVSPRAGAGQLPGLPRHHGLGLLRLHPGRQASHPTGAAAFLHREGGLPARRLFTNRPVGADSRAYAHAS
jgi:tetratricopeptide (TPR) repeat protein